MRARAAKKGSKEVPGTGKDLGRHLVAYGAWLECQPLAEQTGRTYRSRVAAYLEWLAASDGWDGDPLTEAHARDWAVRDYKRYLKTARRAAPGSVSIALAAVDNFYSSIGLGPARVRREDLPQVAPRALDVEEQRRLLRAAERASARDAAIIVVLLYTGLRQLVALRLLGFVPDDLVAAPPAGVRLLAGQLGVEAGSLARYAARSQTRSDHLAEVMTALGFFPAARGELKALGDWLTERALEHDQPATSGWARWRRSPTSPTPAWRGPPSGT